MTDLINQFLRDCAREGKRPSTVETYAMRLKSFVAWLELTGHQFATVDHPQIEDYKRYLFDRGLQPATIKGHLTSVAVLYQWAQRQGMVRQCPVTKQDYPKPRPVRIKRLTDEQLRLFVAYIDQRQENLRAAFWCLLGSGARVGEVAKLCATDVTLRGRAVYLAIHDAKWGSDRTIPVLNAEAARIVWTFRQTVPVDKRPLFRVSRRTLQRYATEFAQQTGVPFKCHLLRHTYAALLTEQGVPLPTIQYLLGHKSLNMTAYYAQSALVDLDNLTPKI